MIKHKPSQVKSLGSRLARIAGLTPQEQTATCGKHAPRRKETRKMEETKQAKKDRAARMRARHHNALEKLARIINPNASKTGVQLWRALNRVEKKAHRAATAYCNGEICCEDFHAAQGNAAASVEKIFGRLPNRFVVNSDPRGYALKLESDDTSGNLAFPQLELERDWGNNQILAPEVNA